MGTISHLPRRDRIAPCRLESEADAEAAASELVALWLQPGTVSSPAERREGLRLSGLLALSLSVDVGGLDCSNVTLARVVAMLERADPLAADALHSHYTLLEHFRAAPDDRFYRQVAERVVEGDLLYCAFDEERSRGPQRLTVTAGDLPSRASGNLRLAASSAWADWLWAPGDAPGERAGALLISVRAGSYRTIAEAGDLVEFAFQEVSAVCEQWPPEGPEPWGTDAALADLLYAARIQGSLRAGFADPLVGDAYDLLRLSAGLEALEALVEKSALYIDQAQVSNRQDAGSHVRLHALKAAVFAADLAGDTASLRRLADIHAGLEAAG